LNVDDRKNPAILPHSHDERRGAGGGISVRLVWNPGALIDLRTTTRRSLSCSGSLVITLGGGGFDGMASMYF